MENVLFIVNPYSEKRKRVDIKRLVENNLDLSKFSFSIKYSDYHGHAFELARDLQKDYKTIVAVGGDGTVNQVSDALTGTDIHFGVVPLGSGNGLARALKIPCKASKAIKRINGQNVIKTDTGKINDRHFVNMAGVGFDAEIAHDFASSRRRGLSGYFFKTVKKFYRYQSRVFTYVHNGKEQSVEAFLISFANSSQYGNNAHISPSAKVDDGLLDFCFMRKFPVWTAPILACRLFFKNADKSKYLDIIKLESLKIQSEEEVSGHLDGEPVFFEKEMIVRVEKDSLNVIV